MVGLFQVHGRFALSTWQRVARAVMSAGALLLFAVQCPAQALAQAQEKRFGFCESREPFKWADNTPEDCPFPRSHSYSEIVFTGRFANYTDADTWYPSWADDDCMYSPWTDGYLITGRENEYVPFSSFSGEHPDYACYSLHYTYKGEERKPATGQAKIIGDDPMHLTIENIAPRVEGDPVPYQGRYPAGSLVYNGVWYYGTYCLTNRSDSPCNGVGWTQFGPFVGFRISKDYGKTWIESPCTPSQPLFGEDPQVAPVKIGAPHFVDFGKNMRYSPDGYAYLTAHGATDPQSWNGWIQGDQIYLIRVKPSEENMNDASAYEFYAGKDNRGRPQWTRDFKQIKPLLEWKDHLGCVTVTYNPGLKKYLMCVTRGVRNVSAGISSNRYDTMILEADRLDGTWRLVKYLDRFGPVAYFVNIPSKFISEDGKTMWLSYSANWHDKNTAGNPEGSYYSFSLHEFTIQ